MNEALRENVEYSFHGYEEISPVSGSVGWNTKDNDPPAALPPLAPRAGDDTDMIISIQRIRKINQNKCDFYIHQIAPRDIKIF